MSAAAFVAGLGLAAFALRENKAETRRRLPAEEAARELELPDRDPEALAALRTAPSGALMAEALSSRLLTDVTGTARLSGLSYRERRSWLRFVRRRHEVLEAVQRLSLSALAETPASSLALRNLGMARYLDLPWSELASASARRGWEAPLALAAFRAPGDDSVWAVWTSALLFTWPGRPDAGGARDLRVLAHGFRSLTTLEAGYAAAAEKLGPSVVASLVPRTLEAARVARDEEGRAGRVDSFLGWEGQLAELRRQGAPLLTRELEEAVESGYEDVAVRVAQEILRSFPFSGEYRRLICRALIAWPARVTGDWPSDPRAAALRWLLDGPLGPESDVAIVGTETTLRDVPPLVHARTLLAAREVGLAEALCRENEGETQLAWLSYRLDRARRGLGPQVEMPPDPPRELDRAIWGGGPDSWGVIVPPGREQRWEVLLRCEGKAAVETTCDEEWLGIAEVEGETALTLRLPPRGQGRRIRVVRLVGGPVVPVMLRPLEASDPIPPRPRSRG